ncbi:MAG: hypothetical protein ACOY3P_26210 [Planctomycetota bacterium]
MTDTNEHVADQETWAVVEVMGHSRYAGRVSQDSTFGPGMLRVEVPACEELGLPAFDKWLSAASLFAVTPCSREFAIAAAKRFRARPFALVELQDLTTSRPALGCDSGDYDDDL